MIANSNIQYKSVYQAIQICHFSNCFLPPRPKISQVNFNQFYEKKKWILL